MEDLTLEEMRDRVRDDGEYGSSTQNNPYITNAMINAFINAGIRLLHAKLVAIVPQRFKKYYDISIVSGTSEYGLPADFMRLRGVYLYDTSAPSNYVPVPRINYDQRHLNQYIAQDKHTAKYILIGRSKIEVYPPPTYSATWRIEYVRSGVKLVADSDRYEGEDLEHEWLINHGLMMCAIKSEDDNIGIYRTLRDDIWRDIAADAEADRANTPTVVNTRDATDRWARRKPGHSV